MIFSLMIVDNGPFLHHCKYAIVEKVGYFSLISTDF